MVTTKLAAILLIINIDSISFYSDFKIKDNPEKKIIKLSQFTNID